MTNDCHCVYRMGMEGKVFNGSVEELFSYKACVIARNRFVCLYSMFKHEKEAKRIFAWP